MNNKAQAAMEFLMTYGWVILIVIVVVGALAASGILSPQKKVSTKCSANIVFACLGTPIVQSGTNKIVFTISQNYGMDAIILANGFSVRAGEGVF